MDRVARKRRALGRPRWGCSRISPVHTRCEREAHDSSGKSSEVRRCAHSDTSSPRDPCSTGADANRVNEQNFRRFARAVSVRFAAGLISPLPLSPRTAFASPAITCALCSNNGVTGSGHHRLVDPSHIARLITRQPGLHFKKGMLAK